MDLSTLRPASVGESLIALKIQECEEKGMEFEEVIASVDLPHGLGK